MSYCPPAVFLHGSLRAFLNACNPGAAKAQGRPWRSPVGPHTPAVSCMLPRAATSRSTAQLPETPTSPPAAQSLPAALLHHVGLAEASPGRFIVSGAYGQLSAWPRCVSLSASVLGHAVNPSRAGSPVLLSLLSRSTPGAPAWRKGPAPRAVQRYPCLCRDVPCNEAQTPGEVHQLCLFPSH